MNTARPSPPPLQTPFVQLERPMQTRRRQFQGPLSFTRHASCRKGELIAVKTPILLNGYKYPLFCQIPSQDLPSHSFISFETLVNASLPYLALDIEDRKDKNKMYV
jgi:hypothetical protein